jgi:hypothetical protein
MPGLGWRADAPPCFGAVGRGGGGYGSAPEQKWGARRLAADRAHAAVLWPQAAAGAVSGCVCVWGGGGSPIQGTSATPIDSDK